MPVGNEDREGLDEILEEFGYGQALAENDWDEDVTEAEFWDFILETHGTAEYLRLRYAEV